MIAALCRRQDEDNSVNRKQIVLVTCVNCPLIAELPLFVMEFINTSWDYLD